MLEIARGRTWVQNHSVLDNEEGPPSDLTGLTLRSQIRKKFATRNELGIFEHALVATVTVTKSGITDSIVTQSLSRQDTTNLQPGDYLIDIVGTDEDGNDESILDPEPIRVINRPTSTGFIGVFTPEGTPISVPLP